MLAASSSRTQHAPSAQQFAEDRTRQIGVGRQRSEQPAAGDLDDPSPGGDADRQKRCLSGDHPPLAGELARAPPSQHLRRPVQCGRPERPRPRRTRSARADSRCRRGGPAGPRVRTHAAARGRPAGRSAPARAPRQPSARCSRSSRSLSQAAASCRPRRRLAGLASQAEAVRPAREDVQRVRHPVGGERRREPVAVLDRHVGIFRGVPDEERGASAVTSASSDVDRRNWGEASSPSRIRRAGR